MCLWKRLSKNWRGYKANIDEAKTQTIDHLNEQIQSQIDSIKAKITKGMSKEQKQALRDQVKELRQTKKDTRAKIIQTARDMYSNARSETNKAYNAMVDYLKGEDAKTKKSKK